MCSLKPLAQKAVTSCVGAARTCPPAAFCLAADFAAKVQQIFVHQPFWRTK